MCKKKSWVLPLLILLMVAEFCAWKESHKSWEQRSSKDGGTQKKNDRQLNSSQQNCSIELKAKLMYNQLKETIDVEEAT